MPYPMIKHSESQYLELETNYLNLFNFAQSLLTITEGEDLDSDDIKLSHFNALCRRINEGVERFSDFTEQIRAVKFKGESTTTSPDESARMIQILCDRDEYELIIESLEHMANSWPNMKLSEKFQKVADDIKRLK